MPRLPAPCLAFALLASASAFALETVSNANDAASLPVGARTAGLAGVALGMQGDPSHLAMSPAGLADIFRPEVVIHHASLYEDLSLSQDEVYLAAPLSYGTLGLGISRVGADGILKSLRGESPDFSNPSTFSATDWIGSVAFARSWLDRRLRAGVALRLLGRDIDGYFGGGAQLDASAVWLQDGIRAGLRLDRGLGGLAVWRSGYSEYTPPDLIAGLGYERRLPYFYGQGAVAWETSGLLRAQSASTFSESDARPWVDPGLFLRSSKLAAEFRFDMGIVLRAGCEVQSLTRIFDFLQGQDQQGQFGESRGSVSIGAGYLWADRVRVDYALLAHPDLGTSQRISLGLVFGSAAPKAGTGSGRTIPVEADLDEEAPRDSVPSTPPSSPEEPTTNSDTAVAPAAVPGEAVPAEAPPVAPSPAKQPLPADEWDAPEQAAP